jgi:hypothetical protein
MTLQRTSITVALLAGAAIAAGSAPAAQAARDARVLGTFTVAARVTTAVNVRGEHRGDRYIRHWQVEPHGCKGDRCASLVLVRERSAGNHDRTTLYRRAAGVYSGTGRFFAPLSCDGKVYPHGSRVPFRITLRVAARRPSGGVNFATAITGSYVNTRRGNGTPCVFSPGHDAGTYRSIAAPPLPTPPTAAFSSTVDPLTGNVAFQDTSSPGSLAAPITARAWSFGDPASGAADSSTAANPTHTYSRPGIYTVRLTVTDSDGLRSSTRAQVVVPASH